MDSYEQRVATFLTADKAAANRIQWRTRSHSDYAAAYISLRWAGPRRPSGLALIDDSSGLADMRVWLDESRC